MAMTIRDIKQMAVKAFEQIESPSPVSDAERLLCFYFEKDRSSLILHTADPVDEARCDGFFQLVDKRAQGIPVQHITGEQEFMGLPFHTTPDALIPRPETELLVEQVLEYLQTQKTPLGGFDILDLCTGSGCIAVSLKSLSKVKCHIIATDLSEKALDLAKENAEKNRADIKFLQGDLFAPFPVRTKKSGPAGKKLFDVIVSNPPYIPTWQIETLRTEVKDHEPRMALDGGSEGLDFYLRILQEAPIHLKPGGLLAMEIGYDQGLALRALSQASDMYESIEIRPDLSGRDRIFWAIRK